MSGLTHVTAIWAWIVAALAPPQVLAVLRAAGVDSQALVVAVHPVAAVVAP